MYEEKRINNLKKRVKRIVDMAEVDEILCHICVLFKRSFDLSNIIYKWLFVEKFSALPNDV